MFLKYFNRINNKNQYFFILIVKEGGYYNEIQECNINSLHYTFLKKVKVQIILSKLNL